MNKDEKVLRDAAKCKPTKSLLVLRAICQRYIDENWNSPEVSQIRKNIMIIDDELRTREDFVL